MNKQTDTSFMGKKFDQYSIDKQKECGTPLMNPQSSSEFDRIFLLLLQSFSPSLNVQYIYIFYPSEIRYHLNLYSYLPTIVFLFF